MTITARCTHNDASATREVVFELSIEMNDHNLEQSEASARVLIGMVSAHAREWGRADDDDREEAGGVLK